MKLNWDNPYLSTRLPVFGRNAVATSHPLAAQAGLQMLLAGGNAADAAIATAAVMTIVEPVSNGLGSDAFCILWDGKQLHGLNASGQAPAAWTPEWFRGRHGEGHDRPPARGWDSVTVPGAVAGWKVMSERFGRLPFADLLAPAIAIAERGYAVPMVVQQKWEAAAGVADLVSQPGFREAFLPRGRAPRIGERFAFPDAARSLALIAATGGEAFYRGEIAEAIARHARESGGAMTAADLAGFAPEWVTPIDMAYGGHELHQIPPNGQGIAALMALGILDNFELAALPVDGVESQHLQIEAMKLAFADVYHHVAELAAMKVTPAQLLDPAYLAGRARLIDRRKAQDFGAGNPVSGGTIYLTAADEQGMMVSFIQSNYQGFGSGVVVPGYGISLQNRGHGFSLHPHSPNVVAPGKRPFHTIIPGFLTRDGAPVMSFGVMGANMQPQGHLQTIVRMVEYRQQPQAACDAPRWRYNAGVEINVEARMDPRTVAGLEALGHRTVVLRDSYQDFGAGQYILRLGPDSAEDGYVVASDPRRDGLAAAY
ncbi:MAG: gamma-glutamyltransferase family protein [Burkholderiaceae bacterium]|nr:gamma-glutamyltransferase family protein [Burkholderiaceae bacterium]